MLDGDDLPYWTKWCNGKTEETVGELLLEIPLTEDEKLSTRVFISHTGTGRIKSDIALPTYWLLTKKCNVEAFLDAETLGPGRDVDGNLAKEAYRCTHALCIISAEYRESKYCIKELNTFMKRLSEEDRIVV